MKKYLILLITLLCFIPNVKAEVETFWSKTLLGRFADGEWQQIGSITNQENEMHLWGISEYYYFPQWIGYYGSTSNSFTADKIYTLNFNVYYPDNPELFNWKKAFQLGQFQIVVDNVVVNVCTLAENDNNHSRYTCQFKVTQDSSSYFEFNYNWYNTNLVTAGVGNGILDSYGWYIQTSLELSSTIDLNGAIVEQNEIIIGQNQQIIDEQRENNEKLDEIQGTITDSDTSGAEGTGSDFFDNFESDDYGLADVITMPLTLIKSLTSSTCVELTLQVPFVNKELKLPCMTSIYQRHFGSFYNLYKSVTFGFTAYWVCIKIFALVKGFKDPDDDKVEVLDL